MRLTCLLPALCIPFLLTAACSRNKGNADADDALYSDCESTEDCREAGLLCDERRGCVECLDVQDCRSGETCRRGLCEGDGAASSDASIDDASAEDAGSEDGVLKPDKVITSNQDGTDTDQQSSDTSAANSKDQTVDASDAGSGTTTGPKSTETQTTDSGQGDASTPMNGNPSSVPSDNLCVMRLLAVFRDFSGTHVDFGDHTCSGVAQGAVEDNLDSEGRPVYREGATTPVDPCLSTAQNFSEWYRDGDYNLRVEKDLVLYADGNGGFVNRYGPNGEPFQAVEGGQSYPGGATLEACQDSCRQYVANEQFNAGCSYYCDTEAAQVDQIQQRLDLLTQAQQDPTLLANDAGVAPSAAEITAEIAELEVDLPLAVTALNDCNTTCENGIDKGAAECASTCLPCSSGSGYCTGGTVVEFDGTPLFFPLDDVTGETADMDQARLPPAYGFNGWPWEEEVFPGAPLHNFYFTTEIEAVLQLATDSYAELEFLGDDDLWVFINGHLALDVGGLHVPSGGTVTLDATAGSVENEVWESDGLTTEPSNPSLQTISSDVWTFSDFELEPGTPYTISIFQAERQKEGSSFRLRLTGFDETSVECPK